MNDIENAIRNKIQYKGSIRIGFQNKKGTILRLEHHNAGQLPLFTCLCRALAGYDITKYRPQYIMCYSKENDEYKKVLISKVVANAAPLLYKSTAGDLEQNTQECSIAEYVFTIPVTALAKTSGDNQSSIVIEKLALINDRNEECASVELSGDDVIELQAAIDTTNILVYWKLEFEAVQDLN